MYVCTCTTYSFCMQLRFLFAYDTYLRTSMYVLVRVSTSHPSSHPISKQKQRDKTFPLSYITNKQ